MRLRAPFLLPIRVVTALASAGGAVAVLAVLAVPAATGCANSRTAAGSPETTLHAYAQALEEGRADAAYRMLSDEARRALGVAPGDELSVLPLE